MATAQASRQQLSSPWGWCVVGGIIVALGVAFAFLPDAPDWFVLCCWAVAGIGGVVCQFAVIAAGVEYGLRRVRGE